VASPILVGIFPSADVASLETALGGLQGIDGVEIDQASVAVAQPPTSEHEASFIEFWHVMTEPMSQGPDDEILHGTGLLTDFGGTDVPGITGSREQSLTDFEEPEDEENFLGSLPLDPDDLEDYNEAIAEGRSVIVYRPTTLEAAAAAKASLSKAGFLNVQIFNAK
jgi:hypothetical protein